MGRWYFDKKDTVEDCRSVSIAFLKKHDYFCGYRYGVITWTNWQGEHTASIGVTVCTADGETYGSLRQAEYGAKPIALRCLRRAPSTDSLGIADTAFHCLPEDHLRRGDTVVHIARVSSFIPLDTSRRLASRRMRFHGTCAQEAYAFRNELAYLK